MGGVRGGLVRELLVHIIRKCYVPLTAFARVVRRTDTEKESLPAQQCAEHLRKVQGRYTSLHK